MATFDFGFGGVPAHRHRNPDGSEGGWVAESATVESTAYVGPRARVSGAAWVYGNARVSGARHHLTLTGLGHEGLFLWRTDDSYELRCGCQATTFAKAREALRKAKDVWPEEPKEWRRLAKRRWLAALDLAEAYADGFHMEEE